MCNFAREGGESEKRGRSLEMERERERERSRRRHVKRQQNEAAGGAAWNSRKEDGTMWCGS
jgi:hypothetical protein